MGSAGSQGLLWGVSVSKECMCDGSLVSTVLVRHVWAHVLTHFPVAAGVDVNLLSKEMLRRRHVQMLTTSRASVCVKFVWVGW